MPSPRRLLFVVVVVVVVVAAALGLAGVAAGQEPTPPPVGGLTFRDELEVVVVNVEVYVRDRRGEPVTDLGRDDFQVFQDGVQKPLSHFAAVTEEVVAQALAPTPPGVAQPGPSTPPAPLPAAVIRPVYVMLYVDNENLDPLNRNRVLRRVREFVTAGLQPPIQMMVVSYDRSLKVVQGFTGDPTEVNAALRSLETVSGGWTTRESARRDLLDRITEEVDRRKESARGGEDQRTPLYGEVLQLAEEEANGLAFSLGALRDAVTMLAGVDGRKSVVYISNGLPMAPGLGLMHEYAVQFGSNAILSQRGRFERQRDFASLTTSAAAQGVSFYTLDARGLEVGLGGSAEDRYAADPAASSLDLGNYQDSLRFLAAETGGLATVNTNDVRAGLDRLRTDLFTYYSLGYTVGPSGQDRVHRVEVRLPGRPDCSLRYRERFVERSLESAVRDRVITALVLDVGSNPLALELERGESAPAAGALWTVPVRLSVPVERLTLIPEGQELVGRLVLFAVARDSSGAQSDVQRVEREVRFPVGADSPGRRLTVDVPFLMEKGPHRVAVGVMDQVTRQASYARVEVEVP